MYRNKEKKGKGMILFINSVKEKYVFIKCTRPYKYLLIITGKYNITIYLYYLYLRKDVNNGRLLLMQTGFMPSTVVYTFKRLNNVRI